jgi:hypothetical protein
VFLESVKIGRAFCWREDSVCVVATEFRLRCLNGSVAKPSSCALSEKLKTDEAGLEPSRLVRKPSLLAWVGKVKGVDGPLSPRTEDAEDVLTKGRLEPIDRNFPNLSGRDLFFMLN